MSSKWTTQQKVLHLTKVIGASAVLSILGITCKNGISKTLKLLTLADEIDFDKAISYLEKINATTKKVVELKKVA